MSSIFLSTEIFIELFLELVLLVVLSYALVQGLIILKQLKLSNTRELQDLLDKKSYLVTTLVNVSFVTKIVLIAFFIYSLNELSKIVPGAMCVTGVLDLNEYGTPLLLLKISILFASSLWLLISKKNLKIKIILFTGFYFLILCEFLFSLSFLSDISTQTVASCCSSKYVSLVNPLPFNFTKESVMKLFYLFYLFVILSAYKEKKLLLLISTSIFIYLSYYAIVYYFGAYIYGDETHMCPFCMLKQEYNFIGYFIYISLFLSIFQTLNYIIFNYNKYIRNKVIIVFTIFLLLVSYSFIIVEVSLM